MHGLTPNYTYEMFKYTDPPMHQEQIEREQVYGSNHRYLRNVKPVENAYDESMRTYNNIVGAALTQLDMARNYIALDGERVNNYLARGLLDDGSSDEAKYSSSDSDFDNDDDDDDHRKRNKPKP